MVIAAGNDRLFETLCTTLGRPELFADPDFASNELRTTHEARLARELERSLRERPTTDWLSELEHAGVPCGPVNDLSNVFNDPQIRSRNMLLPVDDPALGDFRVAGNPIKLSGFPDADARPSAPELDADRDELLAELRSAPGRTPTK